MLMHFTNTKNSIKHKRVNYEWLINFSRKIIFEEKSIVFELPFTIFPLGGLKRDYIEQVYIVSQDTDC